MGAPIFRKGTTMKDKDILSIVDHTLLKQTATWQQIRQLCDDAVAFETASVCIPPAFVKQAKEYLDGRMKVCTVIGFPNGYNTTAVKVYETQDAVKNGADEIDMVINIGRVKEGDFDFVEGEIKAVRQACLGKILKVIIETCLLTEEEKVKLCQIVADSGADYIKTSTGFSEGGATFEDVALMSELAAGRIKVKAAGGISSLEDGKKFMMLGAGRLGTSRIVNIFKQAEKEQEVK